MIKVAQYFFMSWMTIVLLNPLNASRIVSPDDIPNKTAPIVSSSQMNSTPLEELKILSLRQLIPEEYKKFINNGSLAFTVTLSSLGIISNLTYIMGGSSLGLNQTCAIISGTTLSFLVANFILENIRIKIRTVKISDTLKTS